ncbi:MAG: YggS family pyridoxal phosphate-dependent enzyme [Blautia sp.]|nr:YggS family pyridoxal phosphate-dependent enzyme [Blautia sp.]
MVAENIKSVRDRIQTACRAAGRDPAEVTLICVSKTKPVSLIREAYDAGERAFGENKVQEIQDKYLGLPSDVQWHMIGHLQRNKVRHVIDKAVLIHSVDSLRLAQEIEAEAAKKGLRVSILLEVNVAGEDSKYGLTVEEAPKLAQDVSMMPHLSLKGLMTIAPFVDDPEKNREIFRRLKELSVDIQSKSIDNISMDILSMGMTNDYEVAISEGATMVRIGTGIFGERQYL